MKEIKKPNLSFISNRTKGLAATTGILAGGTIVSNIKYQFDMEREADKRLLDYFEFVCSDQKEKIKELTAINAVLINVIDNIKKFDY